MSEVTHRTDRFVWSCHLRGSVAYIGFEGELDMTSVGLATAAFSEVLRERPTMVVLDLGELSYVDSSGLALLIRTKTDVESRAGHLCVSRHSRASSRIVEVCALTEWFAPTDEYGTGLVGCPVCDELISPLSRVCEKCGTAL